MYSTKNGTFMKGAKRNARVKKIDARVLERQNQINFRRKEILNHFPIDPN